MGAGGDLGFCEWILGSAPAQLGELESGVQLERCRTHDGIRLQPSRREMGSYPIA